MAPPRQGILHNYAPRLTAFEYVSHPSQSSAPNLILFVGGIYDGFGTIPYTSSISDALPATWTIAQALLTSSYKGWGMVSLKRDIREIAECVSYFRNIKSGLIVLMGHSTGCQDVMEYLTKPTSFPRLPINGGIMQAPASDREAMLMSVDPEIYRNCCSRAQAFVDQGKGAEPLPTDVTKHFFPCPVSAYRFLSLASPNHDGDDDYFSSDLLDWQLQKSFGSLPAGSPVCILFSEEDEYVPAKVNKADLLKRWTAVAKRGKGRVDERYSGIIEDATHSLEGNPPEVVRGLVERVVGFVGSLTTQSNL